MGSLLAKSLKTAKLGPDGWSDVGPGPGSEMGAKIDWLTIKNLRVSVVEDVERIRNHPLVPKDIPIYGYIYDVASGKLEEVPEAMVVGRAMEGEFAHKDEHRMAA